MRRAGVDRRAHADRTFGESFLGIPRRCERALRGLKRDEERVPLRIDLDTVVGGERAAQNQAMLLECFRVPFRPEVVQQPRRALDIREEEGDGTGRKLPCHSVMITDFDLC